MTDNTEYEKLAEKHYRRLGTRNPRCTCGETAPAALSPIGGDIVCNECQKAEKGESTVEDHHMAGRNNDPDFTIPLPANAHRVVTDYQNVWPTETLRNPDASPLIKASAALRGFLDILLAAIHYVLGWIPPYLEELDASLRGRLGSRWWCND